MLLPDESRWVCRRDRRTNARPLHHAFRYGRGQRNNNNGLSRLNGVECVLMCLAVSSCSVRSASFTVTWCFFFCRNIPKHYRSCPGFFWHNILTTDRSYDDVAATIGRDSPKFLPDGERLQNSRVLRRRRNGTAFFHSLRETFELCLRNRNQ